MPLSLQTRQSNRGAQPYSPQFLPLGSASGSAGLGKAQDLVTEVTFCY